MVKPIISTREPLEVKIGPTVMLKLWLGGFDFSLVSDAITQLSSQASGSVVVLESVEFVRQGRSIHVEVLESRLNKKKAKILLNRLIEMVSSKSAKDISTLK